MQNGSPKCKAYLGGLLALPRAWEEEGKGRSISLSGM